MNRRRLAAATSPLMLALALLPVPTGPGAATPGSPAPVVRVDSTLGPAVVNVRGLPPPVAGRTASPVLATAADGKVWLAYFEPRLSSGYRLMLARLAERGWSTPRAVAEGDSFFVNWAEIPGILPLSGGRLAVSWLWKVAPSSLAYVVRMAVGTESGRFDPPVQPHSDGSPTPHGFVSLAPERDGVRVLWLDGRLSAPRPDSAADTELRSAFVGRDGQVSDESMLDGRACDCCRTALVAVPGGFLAVYRDRGSDETRDISLVRYEKGAWGEPYPLAADGWVIRGCPVNGPAANARGDRVAIAWYSAANQMSRVQVAFSTDGGRTFEAPIVVDAGTSLGCTQVELLEDGSALVLWEATRLKLVEVRVARVMPDGRVSPATVIGTATRRTSGYPQMARGGDRVVFAWMDLRGKGPSHVRLYEATLARRPR